MTPRPNLSSPDVVRLRQELLTMAGRVEQMIERAAQGLSQRTADALDEVRREDRLVNHAELEIDEMCIQILAGGKPRGPELRFTTQALKMVTDLERIGDLAVNLAERARDLSALGAGPIHEGIHQMGRLVRQMVAKAIDAFIEGDVDKARSVLDIDDQVDDLYSEVFRDVLERMRGDGELQRGIHVQSAAKFLERMGDHATNLAEQVVFMIEGEDIRHPRSAREAAMREERARAAASGKAPGQA